MSALEPKAGGAAGETVQRIALAKQAAKDIVASLTPGSDAMILEAGRDARLALAVRSRSRSASAPRSIGSSARDVEGDLGASVALAVDRLRQLGGSRRIVVITDGDLAHPEALCAARRSRSRWSRSARRSTTPRSSASTCAPAPTRRCSAKQVQAFLVVANFGQPPRDLFVTMREDNASDVLASRRVLVQPGERLPVVLTFHPTRGDYDKGLVFDIAPHDAMPVDDVAYARVPAGEKLPVFLAPSGDAHGLRRGSSARSSRIRWPKCTPERSPR